MNKLFLYVVIIILSCCAEQTSTICILNNSAEEVTSGNLRISKYSFKINNIPQDESACFIYKVYADDHYTVNVQLRSGKKLGADIGYITHGFVYHDKIVVYQERLDLINSFELAGYNKNLENSVIPFSKLGNYMEYVIENYTLTIRATGYADSAHFISQYNFIDAPYSNKFYLTYYINAKRDEKVLPEIEYMKWGGVRLKLKVEDPSDNIELYYKDKEGLHKIKKGTTDSWKKYLIDNKFNQKVCDSKQIEEMLKDI